MFVILRIAWGGGGGRGWTGKTGTANLCVTSVILFNLTFRKNFHFPVDRYFVKDPKRLMVNDDQDKT